MKENEIKINITMPTIHIRDGVSIISTPSSQNITTIDKSSAFICTYLRTLAQHTFKATPV
ncbi:MAG: hypothetical protein ACP5I6_07230 [Caldisphaera sp.]